MRKCRFTELIQYEILTQKCEEQQRRAHRSVRTRMLRPLLDFTLAVVLSNCLLTAGSQEIRLVDSIDSCSGRVEVVHNNSWVTVCDGSWNINDAAVLCRQLQCGRAFSAHGQSLFGKGDGSTWIEIDCKGSESSINSCSNSTIVCDHNKDAGVVCTASLIVIIGAVVVAVLFISSALLIIFLVKRNKKRKKLQICSCSNDAVNMEAVLHNDHHEDSIDDDYEPVDMDSVHEDSKSEQDYVNVELEDSDPDYVNMESEDSDQDYVNVDVTQHRTMMNNSYEDF